MSPRPLDGILVADFTSTVAGPWATRLLADCGARVVKIETEGEGDILRFQPPIAGGISRVFAQFNAGKESIALDLKSPEGIAVARQLIEQADIVVENFRPGVMERFGLDFESVKASNPKLIYCSISGFGQTGELSRRAAYAPLVHAYSGLDHAVTAAQSGDGTPPNCSVMIADVVAASYAFGAIQTALIHRERNGLGSHIDVTLMESAMSLVAIQYQEAQSDKPLKSFAFEPIATRDGHVMIALVSVKTYMSVYPLIDRSEWLQNSDFNTLPGVMKNRRAVLDELGHWAKRYTTAECEQQMLEAGVPCTSYRTPSEQLHNPNLLALGSFQTLVDSGGDYMVQNPPFRISTTDCTARTEVAQLGEHTQTILDNLKFVKQRLKAENDKSPTVPPMN